MFKILADTCVWENLAKDPQQRPLLNVIMQLEGSGDLGLIVPRIVLEEWERRKDRITKENTQSVSSLLKRIKAIVGKHGDGDGKAVALEQLNLVDSRLPRLGDAVETAVANIETLLQRGEIVETTDPIMLRAARRALEKKAPFIREKNMADAIILEAFADCVTGPNSTGHQFAFVTDNVNDFSDRKVNDKNPHPDIASIFSKRLAPLGEHLGPILLQFPPARQLNVGLLDSLLGALARPAAVEFRHESWFGDETYRVIRAHQGALVVTDEEKWPRAPLIDLGPVAYFRLRRGYTSSSFRSWIAEVASAAASHDDVHVYLKHDPESPGLAQRLLKSLARPQPPPQPPR